MSALPHRHEHAVRVYYEDTDLGGVVYYANYLKFLERGRTEALRHVGVDQRALKDERGLLFVVRRIDIEYLRPARFDDLLTVTTALDHLRGARVQMRQAVLRGAEPLATAEVTVACMTVEGRPARLPADVATALSALAAG